MFGEFWLFCVTVSASTPDNHMPHFPFGAVDATRWLHILVWHGCSTLATYLFYRLNYLRSVILACLSIWRSKIMHLKTLLLLLAAMAVVTCYAFFKQFVHNTIIKGSSGKEKRSEKDCN